MEDNFNILASPKMRQDFIAISGNGVIWVEISKVLIQIRHDCDIKVL
jgi:hypothetical protein